MSFFRVVMMNVVEKRVMGMEVVMVGIKEEDEFLVEVVVVSGGRE